ncbi:MAG: 3'-5' exonuclease, partial [Clostridia bacterium]
KISNNNRFMVGDIKQSIYKFRLAMPEIFKSKYMSKNNKTVLLAKNFRSRKEVLSSINYIFSSIMTSEIGDSEYLSNEILIHGNKEYIASDCNYGMEINIIDSKINIDDNEIVKEYILELKSFEIESIYIAKRINELIYSKFKVMGKNSLRDIQYKDIVVLLRNMKDKCNILEDTLNKNNIPVFTDNSSNVFNKNETILILSLLKIINNPYLDIELVSVMYSIIGKFSLDEIYTIKNNSKEYMYNLLLKSDNNKCKLFVQLIENFRKYNTFHSISELINKIYMDTDIYNELSLNINSKISKLSLEALVSSATNFNNIYDFVNYIESLNEKSDNSLAKLIGEDEDVVRIMSIHKSKGLEFPIVILASSATKYNQRDLSNAILLNSDFGIGINTIDNNISYPTVIKQGIKSKILKDIKSEELRMLYVALTRAKEKIIVFASINDFDKKYSNLYIKYNNNKIDKSIILKNNSYIQNILYGIDKFLKNATNSKLFELNKIYINDDIIDNNESIDYIDKLNETNFNVDNEVDLIEENLKSKYILDNVNKKVSVSNLKNSKIDVSFKKLNDNITPKRKGTLIHFILEHLDIKSVTSIEYLNNYLDEQVVLNIISSEERDVIDTNKIYNFILSKIGKEIINSTQVKKEVEFILNDSIYSSSSIQGVIDMYYLNSDNTYTLIDFKTDNIFSEDKFREYYSLKLNIYKEAIYKLTNIAIINIINMIR